MRYVALLLLPALVALTPTPKPKPAAVGLDLVATDSTVAMLATVTLKFPLRAGDGLRYNWWTNGGFVDSTDTTATILRSRDFRAPCGTSGTLQVKVRVVYADGTLSPATPSNVLSYTQPACPQPKPEIQGVEITPASVTLPHSGTVQFGATAL